MTANKRELKGHRDHIDNKLNKALKDTFPASDPVSVGQSEREAPQDRPVDRQPAKIDHRLVKRLADEVDKKQREQ